MVIIVRLPVECIWDMTVIMVYYTLFTIVLACYHRVSPVHVHVYSNDYDNALLAIFRYNDVGVEKFCFLIMFFINNESSICQFVIVFRNYLWTDNL